MRSAVLYRYQQSAYPPRPRKLGKRVVVCRHTIHQRSHLPVDFPLDPGVGRIVCFQGCGGKVVGAIVGGAAA